jgi:hypothetical protein
MKPSARRAPLIGLLAFGLGVAPASDPLPDTPRTTDESFPVAIRIDASNPQGQMRPVWRFFGHDEPNHTYMDDGKKLLGQLAALSPEPVYIRTHNLLTSGDGTPALKWGSAGVYSVQSPGGNVLWDCISLIDGATIEAVRKLGGLAAIAISHPHYSSAMVEWSRAHRRRAKVNRVAYRKFSRYPDLPFDRYKEFLGREILGEASTPQAIEDLLELQAIFATERTWCQPSPLVSPGRVWAMASQGKLTPPKRAEYRAALDRLRAIEVRHREPRFEGERELHRIARWVLDRWGDEQQELLEPAP